MRPYRYNTSQCDAWRLYKYGLHRSCKPAEIYYNGTVRWCAYGNIYRTTRRYCEDLKLNKQLKTLFILKYGDTLPTHVSQCDEETQQYWRKRWNAQ